MARKRKAKIKTARDTDSNACVDMERVMQLMDSPEWNLHFLQGLCPPSRLHDAATRISIVANDIVPDVPDLDGHPICTLESLEVFYETRIEEDVHDECSNPFYFTVQNTITVGKIAELTYSKINSIKAIFAHPDAMEEARSLVEFLEATHRLMQKKIALAKVMGLKDAMAKFLCADEVICMVEFSGDIDQDAKQLFLGRKITPDEFRAAMRRAFVLDRQATKEINQSEEETHRHQSIQKKKRCRYPKDTEALETLREAERRSKSNKYKNFSRKEILRSMIAENTKNKIYRLRILKGIKKGDVWEYSHERSEEKELRNWERYFSAYLHRDTNGE